MFTGIDSSEGVRLVGLALRTGFVFWLGLERHPDDSP